MCQENRCVLPCGCGCSTPHAVEDWPAHCNEDTNPATEEGSGCECLQVEDLEADKFSNCKECADLTAETQELSEALVAQEPPYSLVRLYLWELAIVIVALIVCFLETALLRKRQAHGGGDSVSEEARFG
ncbi:hypothetical protein BU23DRAFT_317825 [Bimuria novae-zelandiae CBS 107.79]|uniref:Uncharacterized protein n=1 Tax=Bimuria novae-zelandiae CBS 107.79 TaxID=1447943 RepID=A0A6A5VHF5_9PLEO|nr:hypothetical protein BU23DRAFT_317825 [Bimuria novae-zelandiae CBS 107.79]